MSRTVSTTMMRNALTAAILGLACLWLIASGAAPAVAQNYSSQFLDVLNEACFSDQTSLRSDQPRTPVAGPGDPGELSRIGDLSQICAYDLTCGEVVFSGRIERSRAGCPSPSAPIPAPGDISCCSIPSGPWWNTGT